MKDASISVVIPLFNGAKFIESTLRSVLAQSKPVLEILVIDDGSSDHGAALAAQFERVRVLGQKNLGSNAARRVGVEAARGERIAFLDHDDLWAPWHLAQLAAALDTDPECAFAYAEAVTFFDGSLPRFARSRAPSERVDPWRWQPSCYILSASCVLLERERLLEIGGWTTTVPIHDLYTWLSLSANRAARRVGKSVGYRSSPNSSSNVARRSPERLIVDHIQTLQAVLAARSAPCDLRDIEAKLVVLQHLGALDHGDPAALQDLADAMARVPGAIVDVLSHAHWLYGPRWRESDLQRLVFLRNTWPRNHSTSTPVRGWIDDGFLFSTLVQQLRAEPLDWPRWCSLFASALRRSVRRLAL